MCLFSFVRIIAISFWLLSVSMLCYGHSVTMHMSGVSVSGPCLMHTNDSAHSLILSVSHIRKNVRFLSVRRCLLLFVDLLSSHIHIPNG